MPLTIILDAFPLSAMAKPRGQAGKLTEQCWQWAMDCIRAGHTVRVPAIAYYEVLRELERVEAASQIARLKTFAFSLSNAGQSRFIPLETEHLEIAAQLWAQTRNAGKPTASDDALDGDVILAAQAISLKISTSGFIVATTNVKHLSLFVPCDLWSNIKP